MIIFFFSISIGCLLFFRYRTRYQSRNCCCCYYCCCCFCAFFCRLFQLFLGFRLLAVVTAFLTAFVAFLLLFFSFFPPFSSAFPPFVSTFLAAFSAFLSAASHLLFFGFSPVFPPPLCIASLKSPFSNRQNQKIFLFNNRFLY